MENKITEILNEWINKNPLHIISSTNPLTIIICITITMTTNDYKTVNDCMTT